MDLKNHRHSRKRQKILEELKKTKVHPTAEGVYQRLRKDIPRLSLGTVYRNLNLLCEQGVIQKIGLDFPSDHFDGDTSPHHHFICTSCRAIFDLDFNPKEDLSKKVEKKTGFSVEGFRMCFHGLCDKCKKKVK
ncbi:MAG: hypothetical protein AMJ90_07425 [candidate division Zixibacteria bacterium SM23_73_2]|nr:MAG: hypothetical protein AMJ90_07425 [candidate division Zixibacteria bacterium SM23_73_2]